MTIQLLVASEGAEAVLTLELVEVRVFGEVAWCEGVEVLVGGRLHGGLFNLIENWIEILGGFLGVHREFTLSKIATAGVVVAVP